MYNDAKDICSLHTSSLSLSIKETSKGKDNFPLPSSSFASQERRYSQIKKENDKQKFDSQMLFLLKRKCSNPLSHFRVAVLAACAKTQNLITDNRVTPEDRHFSIQCIYKMLFLLPNFVLFRRFCPVCSVKKQETT